MLHEKFGKHSIAYYHQEIMQQSHLITHKRSVNRWNAFLSGKLKEHNEEHEKQGLSKEKVCSIVAEVSTHLGDQHEVKELALHNVPLNAFQDGRKTLDSNDHELLALNAHTGMEILLFAVCSDVEHFNQLHIFQTLRASAFFDACLGTSMGNIALHLEGFTIAGVQGMAKTHVEEVLEWKKKTEETAAPTKVSRMYYVNFDDNITLKHRIILKNWPLSKFCCPGDISSLNELTVLFHAFDSGATSFQKLRDAEYDQWSDQRFQAALAMQNTSATNEDMPDVDREDESEGQGGTGNKCVVSSETPNNNIVEGAPQRGRKQKDTEFINMVTTSSGAALPVQKKPRAPRKDKGVHRGPRKKKTAQVTAAPSLTSSSSSIMSPTTT
ncbi:uncharacterized protein EDB91DRAFT_1245291 [Suillus paluster]|uniref:uncharacterized protein n=1 Tax=Suillus paluster TaxID=48578 RepID=UPI001B87CA54|nr:uncharacterized protein EDB91DRAFT_1245291 [Suillus paluster]KAG1747806.1 hypothetical protein EDB91DRAFT_1245291 [Suillus paluster]